MYLVSDDKVMVEEEEINSYELMFSRSLPSGYVRFLKQYGVGTYCGTLDIHRPSEIESKSEELLYSLSNKYWKSEKDREFSETLSSPSQICESIDLDRIFFVPEVPEKLFVLPRHDSRLYTLSSDFLQPTAWHLEGEAVRKVECFEYFEPASDVDTIHFIFESYEMGLDQICSFIKDEFDSGVIKVDYSDLTLLFIKQIAGIAELTLHDSGGGVRFDFRPEHRQYLENISTKIRANPKFINVREFA